MTIMSPELRRQTLAIVGASLLLVVGLGGWAVTTEFSGAVIASGQLVVDSSVKKVQHPTGGVVGELHVREGARVAADEIVMRLDDTQTRANLAIVSRLSTSSQRVRREKRLNGTARIESPSPPSS